MRTPADDTQPARPAPTPPPPHGRPALARVAVGLALLLALTSALLLHLILLRSAAPVPLRVTLVLDGFTTTVSTNASTVRELLLAEGLTLHDALAVAPAPDTALTDGMTIRVDEVRSVMLTVDGLTSVFRTMTDNPRTILDNAGIALAPADDVRVNGVRVAVARLSEFPLPANQITVRRAVTVTVIVDDMAQALTTTAETVGEALFEAGVPLYLGDVVQPPVEARLSDGLRIVITRAVPVTLIADGVRIETRIQGATVSDTLAQLGVQLGGLDYTLPSEAALLRPEMTIQVVRVREAVEVEMIPVPFETIYEADATLPLDTTAIIRAGVPGRDQRETRVRYENEVEVRRTDEGLIRVQPPVDQIIRYGTQVVYRTIDTPDGPRDYWRVLRLYATSYHPAALGGDDVTATGRRLQKGVVAIDPRLIPYGTALYVPGYGVGVAADTGGPRRSQYWIDLGYSDDDWVSWSRWVDVYLLAPPPERFPYLLP